MMVTSRHISWLILLQIYIFSGERFAWAGVPSRSVVASYSSLAGERQHISQLDPRLYQRRLIYGGSRLCGLACATNAWRAGLHFLENNLQSGVPVDQVLADLERIYSDRYQLKAAQVGTDPRGLAEATSRYAERTNIPFYSRLEEVQDAQSFAQLEARLQPHENEVMLIGASMSAEAGHALLLLGIDPDSKTLVYVDPYYPNELKTGKYWPVRSRGVFQLQFELESSRGVASEADEFGVIKGALRMGFGKKAHGSQRSHLQGELSTDLSGWDHFISKRVFVRTHGMETYVGTLEKIETREVDGQMKPGLKIVLHVFETINYWIALDRIEHLRVEPRPTRHPGMLLAGKNVRFVFKQRIPIPGEYQSWRYLRFVEHTPHAPFGAYEVMGTDAEGREKIFHIPFELIDSMVVATAH